jgi:hypothetical protein
MSSDESGRQRWALTQSARLASQTPKKPQRPPQCLLSKEEYDALPNELFVRIGSNIGVVGGIY